MSRKSLALALLILGLCVTIAHAGVPKVVVIENLGATW